MNATKLREPHGPIPQWYWVVSPTEQGHHVRVYWRLGCDLVSFWQGPRLMSWGAIQRSGRSDPYSFATETYGN